MNSKAIPAPKESIPQITARIGHAMATLGIAGLPRNYELLFEALDGNASVAREIAALGKAPDQAALDSIALRYSLPSRNVLAAGQAAGEAVRVLSQIAEAAETNRRRRAAAMQEIEEIAARMEKDPVLGISDFAGDTHRLLSILRDILDTDRTAGVRIDDLQTELDGLRSGLSTSREALAHDPVTGLGNHAALLGRLNAFFQAEADGSTAALLMVRVGQLQEFAATHPAGAAERTLKRLATIFRRSVKKNDFVARTGPDVFCLLLCDVSRENAATIAQRIAATVADTSFPFLDRELPAGFLTLTAGIAMSDCANTPAVLLTQAERALSHAAETGVALRLYSAEVAERAGRTYRSG